MSRSDIVATVLAALFSATAAAQTPPPIPSTVEAAEAEGAQHPRPTAINANPDFAQAVGPSDRKCVDVNASNSVAVRSGDFIAGPFDRRVLMGPPGPNQKRKVWWLSHPEPGLGSTLQVRAVKLSAPSVTDRFTFDVVGRNAPFFPSQIRFRVPGDWLVIVTSGESWGCFLMDEVLPSSFSRIMVRHPQPERSRR